MIKLAILLLCFSVINSQNQNEIIQQDKTQEEIINRISVSAITHSAKSFDSSLLIL